MSNIEEYLVLVMLQTVFPKEFSGLQIKDKPDLQDLKRGIGIEVVSGNDEHRMQAERMFGKSRRGEVRNEAGTLNAIEKNGGRILGTEPPILLTDEFSSVLGCLSERFLQKLEKLNSGGYEKELR